MASIAATGFGLSALCIAEPTRCTSPMRTSWRRCGAPWTTTAIRCPTFTASITTSMTSTQASGIVLSVVFYRHRDSALRRAHSARLVSAGRRDRPARHHHLRTRGLAVDAQRRANLLHGLTPENGFRLALGALLRADDALPARAGSPTSVDPACWSAWSRPTITYNGLTYISAADPLFVHQYSHAWFDFRNKQDQFANYFTNSVTATQAHEAFCIGMGAPYSQSYLGISAVGLAAWLHRMGRA